MHDRDMRWERNWRRMEAMARRGFRQFGSFNFNPGDWSGLGGNFRIGRMLASGDLRLVALYLIEQQPRHGYDLIKAIEERSHGFYSPSPGMVYPALTYLEEAGYVTSAPDGNKKLYSITDEGRTHLDDNREAIQSTLDFLGKAGARMEEWRDRMARGVWPFGEEPEPQGPETPAGAAGSPTPPRPEAPEPQPERMEMPGSVEEARKALKRAIREALRRGPGEERRILGILRQATREIRGRFDDLDADLG